MSEDDTVRMKLLGAKSNEERGEISDSHGGGPEGDRGVSQQRRSLCALRSLRGAQGHLRTDAGTACRHDRDRGSKEEQLVEAIYGASIE